MNRQPFDFVCLRTKVRGDGAKAKPTFVLVEEGKPEEMVKKKIK